MKKLILVFSSFLFLLLSLKPFNSYSQPSVIKIPTGINYLNAVPDVMNKVNLLDNISGKVKIINPDSLPIYPGFPKRYSGGSFEGAIICNMDNDSDMEIVINVGYTVQALNLDGTNVPGWPVTVGSYTLEGAPAFGDIDGDGFGEIVVTNHGLTSGGFIYAYKRNGTAVTGFPINHGYSSRTPVLADINNDGKCEIIVNKRLYPVGEVWVYNGNGTVYTGWPKSINHVPASSSAVGDINGDNIPEIISESYTALYAWKANGDSIPGFPFMLPNGDVNSYSAPVLMDLNGDGKREIIFGTHQTGGSGGGYVYILDNNGTIFPNWPKQTAYWIYGPPAIGYIDNDNIIDIAVGDQVLSGTPVDQLYAWNANGATLTGFPVGNLNAINSQVSLGDINNDNNTELIIDDNTTTGGQGVYHAFANTGNLISDFEVKTTGTTFFITPCLTDLNRNNELDLVGGGVESNPSYTNLYAWNAGVLYRPLKIYVPMWQYNPKHTGVADQREIVGINDIGSQVVADKFFLNQNYPNPFNSSTVINFSIPENLFVTIKIFDSLGREVKCVSGYKNRGIYSEKFNADNLSSGIYFYKIIAGNFSDTKAMVLLK